MKLPENKKIILFDGVCNLCNSSVQYIIKRDEKDVFRFAALQSEIGQKLLSVRGINKADVDSIVLIEPNIAYYTKSTAALKIMKQLGGIWNIMSVFTMLPESFKNIVYDYVAKNRYKWYGKKDACMVPTPELKAKFLD